jgi:hypothetical protein
MSRKQERESYIDEHVGDVARDLEARSMRALVPSALRSVFGSWAIEQLRAEKLEMQLEQSERMSATWKALARKARAISIEAGDVVEDLSAQLIDMSELILECGIAGQNEDDEKQRDTWRQLVDKAYRIQENQGNEKG